MIFLSTSLFLGFVLFLVSSEEMQALLCNSPASALSKRRHRKEATLYAPPRNWPPRREYFLLRFSFLFDPCEDVDDDKCCSINNLDACFDDDEGDAVDDEDAECSIDNLDACKPNSGDNIVAAENQATTLKQALSKPIAEVQLAGLVILSSFLVGLGTLQQIPPAVALISKYGELIISAIFTIEYVLMETDQFLSPICH